MAGLARMSDVAKLAGVSVMTVSRVLNESAGVSEENRNKVFDAVRQLRYQPNELARSLRDRRSRQIGIIVPYLSDPFFAICAHAISTAAKEQGYSVVLSTSNDDPQSEFDEACRMLRRHVEGLIVIPSHRCGTRSLLLNPEFESFPIVTLDRPIEGSGFETLVVENEQGAREGTEHLIGLGHRAIAYIGLTDGLYTMTTRHRGYLNAMREAGLQPESTIISRSVDDALAALRRLLSSHHPPTALFCGNNLTTRHVLQALKAMEMRTPDSIALVGFDDFETAELVHSGITVVRQPTELLGRTAAEMLFSRVKQTPEPTGGRVTVLPVELIVRGSSGAEVKLSGARTSPKPSVGRVPGQRAQAAS